MSAPDAAAIAAELRADGTRLGDIKARAKAIGKDHDLALRLWAGGEFHARLLAVLILDRTQLTPELIESMAGDLAAHDAAQRDAISDWLLANQLMKSRKLGALIDGWRGHESPVLRRLYWYQQARRRWTGQVPPPDSAELLDAIEAGIAGEAPEVQWAMNFCAGWIGVHEAPLRARCVRLGETTGLYRDEPVARNCTPNYLPEFIRIEVAKRA